MCVDDHAHAVDRWRHHTRKQQLRLHCTQTRVVVQCGLQGRQPSGFDLDVVVQQRNRGCTKFDSATKANVGAAAETDVARRTNQLCLGINASVPPVVDDDDVGNITTSQH